MNATRGSLKGKNGMLPYYLLIGVPMLLSLASYSDDRRVVNKKFPLLVFFLLFILLLSLRSVSCGIDLMNYRNKFNHPRSIGFFSLFDFSITEPGFLLLTAVCKNTTNSFQFYLFLCALLSLVPIMVLYLKESSHNLLTIALFVGIAPFSMFFSGLRQSIAMGIGAVCYYCCREKKPFSFLLLVFLAYLFHQSSLILLLMYPLLHLKITKKWIPLVVAVVAGCFVFRNQIFGYALQFSDKYERRYVISETGSYTFFILLLLLTVYSFAMLKDSEFEAFDLRNILVFTLILQSFALSNTVAMRLNYYYLIFIPLLIPKVIDCARTELRQVARVSSAVFVCFFVFWFFKEAYTGTDILHVFPYVPFWNNLWW